MNLQQYSSYKNKAHIPDYLKPLPTIKYEVYRQYRIDFHTPKSLVEYCCSTIENWEIKSESERRRRASWPELEDILANSQQVRFSGLMSSLLLPWKEDGHTKKKIQVKYSKNAYTTWYISH